MNYEKLGEELKKRKIGFQYFDTAQEATAWLCKEIIGKNVAFGGSMTLKDMGLFEALSKENQVYWHWLQGEGQRQAEAMAEVYITSANAVAMSGEIVNIDGSCNRVATAIYGPLETYYVCGINKVEESLSRAIYRARNVAAPLNAMRLNASTPCVVDGKCHDCSSDKRICNVMSILMGKPGKQEQCSLILIGEKLGY